MLNRTTIAITQGVRDSLKRIARKDQDYNSILKDLIKLHNASVNRIQNQEENKEGSTQ